jgi:hypothetical protein
LSHEINVNAGADAFDAAEGNMGRTGIAMERNARRGRRTGHVDTGDVQEPGRPETFHQIDSAAEKPTPNSPGPRVQCLGARRERIFEHSGGTAGRRQGGQQDEARGSE